MNNYAFNGKVYIGWAVKDITPVRPAALVGQFYERIARKTRDPISATALALETCSGNGESEQTIIVSCELLAVSQKLQEDVRALLKARLPGFDAEKVFLCATHIHTGPYVSDDDLSQFWGDDFKFNVENPEVMKPVEYAEFLIGRLCDTIAEAWENRKEGGISSELGHAVLGYNRRVVYTDGSAQMYGDTNTINFDTLEGPEDHGVELLYFWNQNREMTGVAVNVACPSQVLEHKEYITADYWGEVRNELKSRYKRDIFVLPLIAAAGDQSPRDLMRFARSESNVYSEPMYNESGLKIIADKIADTVESGFDTAKDKIRSELVLKHKMINLALPLRRISEAEAKRAAIEYGRMRARYQSLKGVSEAELSELSIHAGIKNRYEMQEKKSFYEMELHVIRIGDIAIATNPFELFITYGMRMKARSKAKQTFIVQLACGYGGYLPTAKAVAGGGYSANISNGYVGPDAGQLLVDHTVKIINELWSND